MKRRLLGIAVAMLATTTFALAQTPSGNDATTSRGSQPVQPGAQSGSSANPDMNTGARRATKKKAKKRSARRGGAAANRRPTDSQTSRGARPVQPGPQGTR
jgi:hypothetical protein